VTAAKATTESCTVTRKYGVESEVVVTLINPSDFFATAEEESDDSDDGDDSEVDAGAANHRGFGLHTFAGHIHIRLHTLF
jgi:hypothetical protein